MDDGKLKKTVKLFLAADSFSGLSQRAFAMGLPAISDDAVLDAVLWWVISHLWSNEMWKVLENGVVMILHHREIVVVEYLEVREVSRNAVAVCFGVTQPAVLEVNELTVLTEEFCTNNRLADIC